METEPREALAQTLFEEMERLDPNGDTWERLTPHDRDFYRFSVDALLSRKEVVLAALSTCADYSRLGQ